MDTIYDMNFFRKVIHGRQEYSPKVTALLNHFGRIPIKHITICRTPINAITFIAKIVATVPYDKLYHLFLKIELQTGQQLILEKNEVINMDIFRGYKQGTETKEIIAPTSQLTIDIMLNKTKEAMGNNFFPYQAGSNNCQTFIYTILKVNNLLTRDSESFVLQKKTNEIFKSDVLRKFTNTLTDVAGRFDVIKQGGTEQLSQRNGITDTKIKHILGKKLNGIFMKDEIPEKLKNGWYVINMDDSTDPRNGTHWVALKRKKNNDFYFDPIGIIPPIEVLEKCKNCIYNTKQIQDYNSTACGWFCIAIILWDAKWGNINEFINYFSDNPKENDRVLFKILEYLGV
jgi:hypothetical protein